MTNDNKIKKNQNIFLKNLEEICDYSIMKKKKTEMKKRIDKQENNVDVFYCKKCNYRCSHRGNYNKHLLSKRHLALHVSKNEKKSKKSEGLYKCDCGKEYKHRQSLENHQEKCKVVKEDSMEVANDDKPSYNDLMKIIGDLIPKVGNNNNNVTNNNINIQLLLSENCGDAMTIQNFADKLTLTIEDLLKERKMIGNVGNIVVENLRPIPLLKRPIHCTDVNNSTWMVNDAQDGWKEDDGKKLIKETGFSITKKFQALWDNAYPNWRNDTHQQQHYTSLVEQLSMEHTNTDIDNILQQLGPKCTLTAKEIEESLK